MTIEDEYKLLVSGYYGVYEMDEYSSKAYILDRIEKYIKEYIEQYKMVKLNYKEIAEEVEKNPLKTKLQDSLLILNRVKAPLELTLLIRNRLNEMNKNN